MAYITQANYKRIFRENLDSKKIISDQELSQMILCEDIPDTELNMLNKPERRALLAFKKFVQCPDIAVDSQYRKANTEDTKTYVFEYNYPAYHNSPTCDHLLKDFDGILLPDSIRDGGEEVIAQYREWYRDHISWLEEGDTKRSNFYLLIHAIFGVRKEDIQEVHYKNSGVTSIETQEKNVLMELKNLLQKWQDWVSNENDLEEFDKRCFVLEKSYQGKLAFMYNKEEKLNWGKYPDSEIRPILETIQVEFKQPLERLLRDYYMVKYNPELEVEKGLLDQLGFRQCSYCYPQGIRLSILEED